MLECTCKKQEDVARLQTTEIQFARRKNLAAFCLKNAVQWILDIVNNFGCKSCISGLRCKMQETVRCLYVYGEGGKLVRSGLKALSRCVFMGKELLLSCVGECEIIRGCHNRDKGTAENERLRALKFIFSYPKNKRLIFLCGRNVAQKEISTMRVG